mgnify:CR=1 FL=1
MDKDYIKKFNDWSKLIANALDDEDEAIKDILYYLTCGIVSGLYDIAEELKELNDNFKRPIVVDKM